MMFSNDGKQKSEEFATTTRLPRWKDLALFSSDEQSRLLAQVCLQFYNLKNNESKSFDDSEWLSKYIKTGSNISLENYVMTLTIQAISSKKEKNQTDDWERLKSALSLLEKHNLYLATVLVILIKRTQGQEKEYRQLQQTYPMEQFYSVMTDFTHPFQSMCISLQRMCIDIIINEDDISPLFSEIISELRSKSKDLSNMEKESIALKKLVIISHRLNQEQVNAIWSFVYNQLKSGSPTNQIIALHMLSSICDHWSKEQYKQVLGLLDGLSKKKIDWESIFLSSDAGLSQLDDNTENKTQRLSYTKELIKDLHFLDSHDYLPEIKRLAEKTFLELWKKFASQHVEEVFTDIIQSLEDIQKSESKILEILDKLYLIGDKFNAEQVEALFPRLFSLLQVDNSILSATAADTLCMIKENLTRNHFNKIFDAVSKMASQKMFTAAIVWSRIGGQFTSDQANEFFPFLLERFKTRFDSNIDNEIKAFTLIWYNLSAENREQFFHFLEQNVSNNLRIASKVIVTIGSHLNGKQLSVIIPKLINGLQNKYERKSAILALAALAHLFTEDHIKAISPHLIKELEGDYSKAAAQMIVCLYDKFSDGERKSIKEIFEKNSSELIKGLEFAVVNIPQQITTVRPPSPQI